ncbi:NIPSNAP family protein [Niveispirillum sp. KHB5.9]|uniref:NIPSNAP family protein n=1 Tax=Niveispirillum sp. KHB5.9 TaxID=3400269 RepID=UPI003A8841B2
MLVEQRTYTLQVGGASIWLREYERLGKETQLRILPRMLGYFTTEIGVLNQVVHLWGYDSFEQRLECRTRLFADPQWLEFVAAVTPIIVTQESKLLLPASFSPMR